jgi:hypothetical protein
MSIALHHHTGHVFRVLSRTAVVVTPLCLESASLPGVLSVLWLSIMLSVSLIRLSSDYKTSAQSSLIHCSTNLYLTKCVVPFARAALSPLHHISAGHQHPQQRTHSSSVISPQSRRQYTSTGRLGFGLATVYQRNFCSGRRWWGKKTYPYSARRRRYRPFCVTIPADCRVRSAESACVSVQYSWLISISSRPH